MTHWHPSSDQLIEFCGGSGAHSMNIVISTHLHFCSDCRRTVSELQSTAAVMFEQQVQIDVGPDSFANLMAKISTDPKQRRPKAAKPTPSRFPPVIEKLMKNGAESLNWRKPMKNLRVSQLLKDESGLVLGIHHLKAGGRIPHHSHRGNEISVVIEGGFSDEIGSYGPGDFIHLSNEHKHSPQADADGDCWLLTLVEAPVKLSGPVGWVLNPFLKT